MTNPKMPHDCCSADAKLFEVNDPALSDLPSETAHDCCSPAIKALNMDTQLSLAQPTSLLPGTCSSCGHKGKAVDGVTVKAMLEVSLLAVRDVAYFFCKEADCPVVYFSADGTQTFTTEQLRERVFQKEPEADDVFVCYCFRYTPGSNRAELIETGQSTVVEAINVGTKSGQCACDLRNPHGACCLGNVGALVKRIEKQVLLTELDRR